MTNSEIKLQKLEQLLDRVQRNRQQIPVSEPAMVSEVHPGPSETAAPAPNSPSESNRTIHLGPLHSVLAFFKNYLRQLFS